MRIALVQNNKVDNIAEVDPDDVPDFLKNCPVCPDDVGIDWQYIAGVFIAPAAKIVDKLDARSGMQCSRMQGILALGPVKWAVIMSYKAEILTTFAQKIVIDESAVWLRNSQNIAFFAYLLGLDDEQVDALFETAMAIQA